jgi:hypothetical protein
MAVQFDHSSIKSHIKPPSIFWEFDIIWVTATCESFECCLQHIWIFSPYRSNLNERSLFQYHQSHVWKSRVGLTLDRSCCTGHSFMVTQPHFPGGNIPPHCRCAWIAPEHVCPSCSKSTTWKTTAPDIWLCRFQSTLSNYDPLQWRTNQRKITQDRSESVTGEWSTSENSSRNKTQARSIIWVARRPCRWYYSDRESDAQHSIGKGMKAWDHDYLKSKHYRLKHVSIVL